MVLGVGKYENRSGKFWYRDIRPGKCWYYDNLEVIVRRCHVTWEELVPWSRGAGNTLVAYRFFAVLIPELLLLVYQFNREPFPEPPSPAWCFCQSCIGKQSKGAFVQLFVPGSSAHWRTLVVLLLLHRRRLYSLHFSMNGSLYRVAGERVRVWSVEVWSVICTRSRFHLNL